MAAVQMAYTGVFGWYANWLFLRSGGVVAPMTAHVWCNVMGLPNPVADQERHPKNAACKSSLHRSSSNKREKLVLTNTSICIPYDDRRHRDLDDPCSRHCAFRPLPPPPHLTRPLRRLPLLALESKKLDLSS